MDNLENRLLFRVMESLNQFKTQLYHAGNNVDIGSAHYFIGDRGFASTPFMHLREEFFRGLYDRIDNEKDPFEKAYAFLATQPGFVKTTIGPIMREEGLRSAQITENATMEVMLKGPDLLARAMGMEIDLDASMTEKKIYLAGANLLYHFQEREILSKFGSSMSHEREQEHGKELIIQQFKDSIEEILLMGKITAIQPVRDIDYKFSPEQVNEFLKVVQQNPKKFVERFAAAYGYDF